METVDERSNEKTERWFVFVLSAWAAGVFFASRYGLFTQLPRVLIAFLVVIGIAALVTFYYLNDNFRAYITSIPMKHLTIFQVYRLPIGLVFLYYGSQNWLPETFVRNAGYGDIAVGLLVPIVLMMRGGDGKYLAFQVFGLLDFIVAVGTGLTFTLLGVPLMENIAAYPIAIVPLFAVCVNGAIHIMAIDILLRKRRHARGQNFVEDRINTVRGEQISVNPIAS